MSKFSEIEALVASLKPDADKTYEKGNKAAATRVREGMQKLKTLAQEVRQEVLDIKKKGYQASDDDETF